MRGSGQCECQCECGCACPTHSHSHLHSHASLSLPYSLFAREAHRPVVEGVALELAEGVNAENAVHIVESAGAERLGEHANVVQLDVALPTPSGTVSAI